MATIAFGLGPVIRTWAPTRGAGTLLGAGGEAFLRALEKALADTSNSYLWQTHLLDFDQTRNAIGWYEARNLARCQYTNWELFQFHDRPDLWPRTTWWEMDNEVSNPLENWP